MKPPMCGVCNVEAELVPDSAVYGRDFGGHIWRCPTRACDCYVGAHRGSNKPKGTLAGPALRKARMAAHVAFDGWWKREGIHRRTAYRELAARMSLGKAHIGEMNEAQCARVVELFPPAEVTA